LYQLLLQRLLGGGRLTPGVLKASLRLVQAAGCFCVPLLPLLHFQARRLGLLLGLCEGLLALLGSVLELAQLGLPLSELLLGIVELLGGLGMLLLQLCEGLGGLRQLLLQRLLGGSRVVFGVLKGCLHVCTSHLQLLLQSRLGLLCFCKSGACLFDFLAQGVVLCTAGLGNFLQARLFCFVGLLTCLECRTHLGEGVFEPGDGMCQGIYLFLELLVGLNEL
jgi:hypothetical protein